MLPTGLAILMLRGPNLLFFRHAKEIRFSRPFPPSRPTGHRLFPSEKNLEKIRFDVAVPLANLMTLANCGTPLIKGLFLYIWGLQIELNFVPA